KASKAAAKRTDPRAIRAACRRGSGLPRTARAALGVFAAAGCCTALFSGVGIESFGSDRRAILGSSFEMIRGGAPCRHEARVPFRVQRVNAKAGQESRLTMAPEPRVARRVLGNAR